MFKKFIYKFLQKNGISIDGTFVLPTIVNYIDNSPAFTLSYATAFSAGFDLCSAEECIIKAGEWKLVDTGLKLFNKNGPKILNIKIKNLEFSLISELQIRPRSGLAAKYGISVLNAPGTIDLDYEGKILICLFNFSKENFHINKGERIAQAVFSPVIRPAFIKANQNMRGQGGFGSTGK